MTTVLASIDTTESADRVVTVSDELAALLDADVAVVHVREPGAPVVEIERLHPGTAVRVLLGDPATEITRAVSDPDVLLAVVGARSSATDTRPAGHIAAAILESADKPVVVVPPHEPPARPDEHPWRVLVPLEGTVDTTDSVQESLAVLTAAGAELVALHCFDETTVPRFWGAAAHTENSYAAAFRDHWCGDADADVRLRRGSPATAVVEVAADEHVDLIALGWRQDLSAGHARTVRSTLRHARVPVLLVPIGGDVRKR